MDVTPFLGDSYKYKFGGMEYSDEFDINTYDFGMRNYDPALGRWMNIDPMAEVMRRHSPYNYAFNSPVFFIDPDGMMPGGFANINPVTSTGSMEVIGGFDVNTLDENDNVVASEYHANVNDANNAASGIGASIESSNNSAAYSKAFQQAGERMANSDLSLGIKSSESNPFYATIIIDKSVPEEMFGDIAIIREDPIPGKDRTFPPDKYGKINKVDGAFLREQPEDKEWFKISNYTEATIYYNSKKGLYIEDTTARFNPIRLYEKKYYVDWVDKNDNKRGRPTKNPFENN